MSNRRETVLRAFFEQADFMNERVQTGIELHRKGWANLAFVDGQGRPVPGVTVEASQRTHDFHYGANLFMLDELESDEKNAEYRRLFADAFNMATVPFYWRDLEPERGRPRFDKDSPRVYRRPAIDRCLEYCEANGVTPKEHCLVYDFFTPDWVPRDVDSIKRAYEERFRALSERYAARIHGWEVINETLAAYHRTPLEDEPGLVEWAFRLAERYFPNNELILNEMHSNVWGPAFHGDRSAYYLLIERALNKGCRIDSIGMQFHMFSRPETEAEQSRPYYDPRALYAVMDRYADFGLPFQITELTIPAHDEGAENEQIQAEIIRLLYSIWFSHPNMEAIMYWNLVDGYAAYAPQGDMTCGENQYRGGLVRFDFTPKPSYYMVRDLFRKVWHTEAAAVSREDGRARFKGFYGEYDLTIHAGEKTVTRRIHLTKNGTDTFKIEL